MTNENQNFDASANSENKISHAADGIERIEVNAVNSAKGRELYNKRQQISPKITNGKFRILKWAAMIILLAIYYIAPLLRWHREGSASDQFVLADFEGRRFYFGPIEIWPQEVYYITGLLILAGVGLFLATSLFGRIWCGYACPQTVWTDLFIYVERLFEGERNQRMRLDKAPWSFDKAWRKIGKHIVWLIISLLTGGWFVMYFNDAYEVLGGFFTGKAPKHVIRRALYTLPGNKFSRQDIIRSQREISNLCFFDAEKFGIVPVPHNDGTVDIDYTLTAILADQLELQAGFGGGLGITGTIGVSFNNFALKNIGNLKEWDPLPMGDGQKLSIRGQANGKWYNSVTAGFTEPRLGGKKPTSLSINLYRTFFAGAFGSTTTGHMTTLGAGASLSKLHRSRAAGPQHDGARLRRLPRGHRLQRRDEARLQHGHLDLRGLHRQHRLQRPERAHLRCAGPGLRRLPHGRRLPGHAHLRSHDVHLLRRLPRQR